MPFPTAILANALAPLLEDRCTLESPVAGGGWQTEATGVPCRQEDLPDGLAAAMAPFSGGVRAFHVWRFWLPGTVACQAQWRLTHEATGIKHLVMSDNDPATAAPFRILDVREA